MKDNDYLMAYFPNYTQKQLSDRILINMTQIYASELKHTRW